MMQLTIDEHTAFVETASAFLAQREKLEFYREQAAAVAGAKAGKITIRPPDAEAILALTDKLYRLLVELKRQHPETGAYRYRRHLFFLTRNKSQGIFEMHVLPEASIDSIE
jgi:hypothetical protein